MRFSFCSNANARRIIFCILPLFTILGLIVLSSAYAVESSGKGLVGVDAILLKQGAIFLIGWVFLFIVSYIPYRLYRKLIIPIVIASILSMVLLFIPDLAITRNNAVRWVDLPFVGIVQPSEIFKLGFILIYSYLFASPFLRRENLRRWSLIIVGIIATIALFAYQPDYGTLVLLIFVFFVMAFVSEYESITLKKILLFVSGLLIFILGLFHFSIVPDYLKDRIVVSVKLISGTLSEEEKQDIGFHTLQNLEQVQEGGLLGSGFTENLSIGISLPELTTDSIFALFANQFGFLGSLLVISFFLILIYAGFSIAYNAQTLHGRLIAIGLITLFSVQVFVNVLVVLGAPPTGIPLAFFSRGGSALLTTFLIFGVLLSIARRSRGGLT